MIWLSSAALSALVVLITYWIAPEGIGHGSTEPEGFYFYGRGTRRISPLSFLSQRLAQVR